MLCMSLDGFSKMSSAKNKNPITTDLYKTEIKRLEYTGRKKVSIIGKIKTSMLLTKTGHVKEIKPND